MSEKNTYRLSRITLSLISLLVFQIMFINEDISIKVVGLFLTLIMFCLSFISTPFSKKILHYGDKLQGIKKMFYYITFPFLIVIMLLLYMIVGFNIIEPVIDNMHGWDGLGLVLMFGFTVIVFGILISLPYFQTLIVIAIRKIKGVCCE